MEEIKKEVVNENEKVENGGGVEAKSAFLTEIKPHVAAIIKIAERYANPKEGERKPVAIAIAATDQEAEVNTTACCGTGRDIRHALCELACSDDTMERIFMNAAARVAASGIAKNLTKLGALAEAEKLAEKAKDGSQE